MTETQTIQPTNYMRNRIYAVESSLRAAAKLIEPAQSGKKERLAANMFDFGQQPPLVTTLASVPCATTLSALAKPDSGNEGVVAAGETEEQRITASTADFALLAARAVSLVGSFSRRTTLVVPAAYDIEIDVVFRVMQDAAVAGLRRLLERSTAAKQPAVSPALEKPFHAQPSAARLRVDRIAAIQAATGLPMQTLASILQISRPCLYKWIDSGQDITLHGENRERLATIERLAAQWQQRSPAPLGLIAHEPLKNGHTVLELLAKDAINEKAVLAAFDQLVEKLKGKPKSPSQRMADVGFKRRPTHRSLPKDE